MFGRRKLETRLPNTRLTRTTTSSPTYAMPKRRAAPNDDSDEGPSYSAKRARTEEDSDDEVEDVPTQTQTRVRRAGKGKQRAIDVDVDDDLTLDGDGEEEDVDDEEQEQELQRVRQGRRSTGNNTTQGGGGGEDEDEEDDEQFEAQNGDKIRAKLESKRHVQGVSSPPLFLSFLCVFGRADILCAGGR